MSITLYAEGYLGICGVGGKAFAMVVIPGSVADRMLHRDPECGDQLVAMWLGLA